MDLTELLTLCVTEGASDLHLSAGLAPRLRIDGELHALALPALTDEAVLTWLEALVGAERLADYRRTHELDGAIDWPGLGRFRLNAFRQQRGAAAVLRRIPSEIPPLETLLSAPVFRQIASLPSGLVLVCGPTGSGKSTTLASLLDWINRQRRQHILTLEDPVEFVHQPAQCLISQREVGRDTRDFSSALRAALREDPDILLIGELRDLESIRLALTAAETGHLVFATLHTASAAQSIDRLIDVFPGDEKGMVRSLLSGTLQAVIAQQLLPRSGGGRMAVQEVLLATPAVRNLIREDRVAQIYSAMQTGGALGMQTLDAGLARLLEQGLISRDAARALARSPQDF